MKIIFTFTKYIDKIYLSVEYREVLIFILMSHPDFSGLSDVSNFTVTPEKPQLGIAMRFAKSVAA